MTQTFLQRELTLFYDMEITTWIATQQEAGSTYREIAHTIYVDTGFRPKPATLQRWMSQWRNGR